MSGHRRDPQLLVMGGQSKIVGRPRVEDPMVAVLTRLPPRTYDKLIKLASRQNETASSLVRQILMAQSFLK